MSVIDCDIAVLGSGFGGSLTAIIARRLGLSVALLERGTHPRFAIGESSTPLADFKLARIADRFGLDWFRPFAKYGSWKRTSPEVGCGLKRGFSFFGHQPGQAFDPGPNNERALLVAASPDDEHSDTHWFRADFDAHLVGRAEEAGAVYSDRWEAQAVEHSATGWRLTGMRPDGPIEIRASFLVDATGDGQMVGRTLGIEPVAASELRARSRALYSHFINVEKWHDVLEQENGLTAIAAHPFPCDAAALHHVLDHGWMWVLRFDNGITSAGFSLDPDKHPLRAGETPQAEWDRLLAKYPSLCRQFAKAERIRPFTQTGRLQRRLSRAAGNDWALLPHSAGFLDPWLSPGIAQTLYAVERLGRIFAEDWRSMRRSQRLADYGASVLRELAWVDDITGACFECFDRFPVLAAVSMVYFVAAIYCEEEERAGNAGLDPAFLLADHDAYRAIAAPLLEQGPKAGADAIDEFAARARRALEPYDRGGLCDPGRANMYPFVCKSPL